MGIRVMQQKPRIAVWMAFAFLVELCLAVFVFVTSGAGDQGTMRALEITGKFSFLLFWCAYAGSALQALFGETFRPLARRGREFGLAFASAHLVHLALVVWLYHIVTDPPVSGPVLVFFATGFVWTYVLTLFSIKRFARVLGPRGWAIVRTIGLEYISLVFLKDFAKYRIEATANSLLVHLPFLILCVSGTALRLAAWLQSRFKRPIPASAGLSPDKGPGARRPAGNGVGVYTSSR